MRSVLGVNWPPTEIKILDEHDSNNQNLIIINIEYETPLAPIQDPYSILANVLEKHKAKAIIGWEKEDFNSGWFYMNPEKDLDLSKNYEHYAFILETGNFYDDNEDDLEYEWDSNTFWDNVFADVGDPDFE